MYYMLEYYSAGERDIREIKEFPKIPGVDTWLSGQRITAAIAEPIVFELEPVDEGGVEPQELFNSTALIMREDLANALREGGADNFDAYGAVLGDPHAGKKWTNYVVVNVIGAVAAADLGKSVFNAGGRKPIIDVDFESVVIDETKTLGLRLFRLAECMTAVVIHGSVKDHLVKRGFGSLTFVPPEEWIG